LGIFPNFIKEFWGFYVIGNGRFGKGGFDGRRWGWDLWVLGKVEF